MHTLVLNAICHSSRFVTWEEIWSDYQFLVRFFWYFSSQDRLVLGRVSMRWREVLYQPKFWSEVRPVLHCRTLRTWTDNNSNGTPTDGGGGGDGEGEGGQGDELNLLEDSSGGGGITDLNDRIDRGEMKTNFYLSLKLRGFENLVLLHANDADVFDFIQNFPHGAKHVHGLTLRCSNLSDRGLEALIEFLQGLYQLEIAGCNEVITYSWIHASLLEISFVLYVSSGH